MKKILFKFFATLVLVGGVVGGASAQSQNATTIAVSGSFVGTCNLTTGNSLALGVVDLQPMTVFKGTPYSHLRIPVSLGVTCNSESLPWRMWNTTGAGLGTPLSIGSITNNQACLSMPQLVNTPNAAFSTPSCANQFGTGDKAPFAATGSKTFSAELVVWRPTYGNINVVGTAFSGNGAISASIPMTIEY